MRSTSFRSRQYTGHGTDRHLPSARAEDKTWPNGARPNRRRADRRCVAAGNMPDGRAREAREGEPQGTESCLSMESTSTQDEPARNGPLITDSELLSTLIGSSPRSTPSRRLRWPSWPATLPGPRAALGPACIGPEARNRFPRRARADHADPRPGFRVKASLFQRGGARGRSARSLRRRAGPRSGGATSWSTRSTSPTRWSDFTPFRSLPLAKRQGRRSRPACRAVRRDEAAGISTLCPTDAEVAVFLRPELRVGGPS